MSAPSVILIENDLDFTSSFSQLLELDGYAVQCVKTPEEALNIIAGGQSAVIFADIAYRRVDAAELISALKLGNVQVPFILMADPERLGEAKKLGAFAVLHKPLRTDELFETTARATASIAQVQPAPAPKATIPVQVPVPPAAPQQPVYTKKSAPSKAFEDCLPGKSPAIIETRERLMQLSATDEDILIVGEGGLFKKDIAQEIYLRSSRHAGPFIAVKSDSFSPEGFEEELLGVDSEVLSASSGKKSLLDQSLNGVLYIEDVDKLTLMAQASLINIIASRTQLRSAGLDMGALNFRLVVSAGQSLRTADVPMNENLIAHLERNAAFAPPLRERGVDAVVCFDHYLKQQLALDNLSAPAHSARLMRFLMSHPWPGNVAEVRTASQQYANELRKSAGIPVREISNPVTFKSEPKAAEIIDTEALSRSK